MRRVSFVSLLIEVLEFLLAELLMTCQIEVAAMGHLEFTEVGAGGRGKRYSTSNVPQPSFA